MKYLTRTEAATAKDKAVRLMESIDQSDRADEFRRMSVEQYAVHRGVALIDNPRSRSALMATKAELQDTVDQLEDLLEEALDPELSREELVGKVKEAKDVLEEEPEEEEDSEDSGLDEDGDEED
jgi:hypothetical protein